MVVRGVVDDSLLESMKNHIEDLENKRTHLLCQVTEVEASLRLAQAQYGKVLNQNTFISSLPNEILVKIFKDGQQLGQRRSRLPFEILVSHVCSHWREVATGTPSLWTTIHCVTLRAYDNSMKHCAVYLERSIPCLLDMRFYLTPPSCSPNVLSLLDMIIANVGRWRRLSIVSDYEEVIRTIFSLFQPLHPPFLEHLSIYPEHTGDLPYDENNSKLPPIFTGSAPMLSFVRLAGFAMYLSPPPLAAVTTLHLDAIMDEPLSCRRLHFMLSMSPSLTHLSLLGVPIDAWPSNDPVIIEVPTLRSLRIAADTTTVYRVLSAILAPRLESLALRDTADNDTDFDWDASLKFPTLKSLMFSGCRFSEFTCRSFFRAFPTITHFTLVNTSFNETLLRLFEDPSVLSGLSSSSIPWPGMHTVTVHHLDCTHEALLCALVSTRKRLGRPLIKLRLDSETRIVLKRRGRLGWLQDVVDIERLSSEDPWPLELGYVDEDDIF